MYIDLGTIFKIEINICVTVEEKQRKHKSNMYAVYQEKIQPLSL